MAADLANLLAKLAGKRKTQKKKNSVFSKLKTRGSSTEKRALEAAAIVAATRRMDYSRLSRERVKIGDVIQKATSDYKRVEAQIKDIEKEELVKVTTQLQRPRGLFW